MKIETDMRFFLGATGGSGRRIVRDALAKDIPSYRREFAKTTESQPQSERKLGSRPRLFAVSGGTEIELGPSARLFQGHRVGSPEIHKTLSHLNAITAHVAPLSIGEFAQAKAGE